MSQGAVAFTRVVDEHVNACNACQAIAQRGRLVLETLKEVCNQELAFTKQRAYGNFFAHKMQLLCALKDSQLTQQLLLKEK